MRPAQFGSFRNQVLRSVIGDAAVIRIDFGPHTHTHTHVRYCVLGLFECGLFECGLTAIQKAAGHEASGGSQHALGQSVSSPAIRAARWRHPGGTPSPGPWQQSRLLCR